MLFGTGSNGKSTFITLLRTLLGMENIASRGLVDLEKNRFAMADLYLKLANLYADLEDVALRTTGKLKMLTGKDTVTAEHKFRNGFPFVNYAKMVFSANKIPEVLDDSDAFFRRWVIITFPNQFTKDSTTKEDRNLIQKLSTADELSGLLNFALEGLKRLRANNWHFSNPKTTEEIRTEYIRKSSPIEAFLMDCTDPDVESFVPRAELFSTFSEYCHQNKLPVPSTDVFFKRLPQINPRLLKYYPGLKLDGKEKRVHCIKGLKLRQRQDWGKNRENDDADAETKESENPAQTEQPAQNKTLDPSVQGVQRVQGSAYLSVTEEIIEQAANTLREKLPILRLRDSSELVTYLQNLYGRDTAERMVKQLKPRLQSNPEGYLELI
jgi:putative DNA primase/helicase